MAYRPKRSWIENAAVKLGIIPGDGPEIASPGGVLSASGIASPTGMDEPGARAGVGSRALPLRRFPPADQWNDFVELDAKTWPHRAVERRYQLVPTTCFNCESACGLLAYVDQTSGTIRKLEGNPLHPGSRGKNCAKGPATINQVTDPDRILTPMKRVGPRGAGQWVAISWDEALADIGGRVRKAIVEKRRDEIVYHVGRPGAEGFIDRVLRAWGVDGHNSHTNICSSGARVGYALWSGIDRPAPDYANARFILALNAHLESGHYFNPHAQRISEGLAKGAKLAVVDPRLSNTASHASYWLPTIPGTEAALMLGLARVILEERLYNAAYVERWVNWREYLASIGQATGDARIEDFFDALRRHYAGFTPEYVEAECGIPAETIVKVAREIAAAGARFCSHTWRGAASAHLGGWQVARCLFLLHALTGSVGTEGGCSLAGWHKYKASLFRVPPPQDHWNELHWPREFPLTHYEMSHLLPHFLKDGRGRIDTYFTRVFNPVWTYPDGFTWIEALRDESKVGLHVALTPTWNETAFFADYVLPMGHGPERHDLNTYETHSGTWIAFRQPVLREVAARQGRKVRDTRDVNPGQVWEEDEFWIALCWAVDPDGSLAIRKYFESEKSPGTMLTVDEYYEHAFDRVPGLPEAAKQEGMKPLEYMRRVGAFEVKKRDYLRYERKLSAAELEGSQVDAAGRVLKGGAVIGIQRGSEAVEGFPTPSRLLEFYSATMVEWGWPDQALPGYIGSQIWEFAGGGAGGPEARDAAPHGAIAKTSASLRRVPGSVARADAAALNDARDFCLLPTFRLPTLIHTRSGAAKWLNEISQRNPIWLSTHDASRLGLSTGDLCRVTTGIGHFVDKVWVTEGVRPGVVACSHHLGRWRRPNDPPNSRWSGSVVNIDELGDGRWRIRPIAGPGPFESSDPDSQRVWWREGGVHQNITFPVQPDPISGMHCWHQRVRVEAAQAGDVCGDVLVDTKRSMEIYRAWMKRTRWPAGPGDLRRPLWLNRPLRPTDGAYRL